MRKRKAFTLIELLIAVSIFSAVVVTIYSAFSSGIFGYRNIEENISIYQEARMILERINLDLRNSFVYSSDDTKFVGNKDGLSFLTLVDSFRGSVMVPEYAFVSYRSEANNILRLCRKGKEALREKSEVEPQLMAEDAVLSFEYGHKTSADSEIEFKDSWGLSDIPEEKKTLPLAIKVNLTIKGKIEKEFERTIYLP